MNPYVLVIVSALALMGSVSGVSLKDPPEYSVRGEPLRGIYFLRAHNPKRLVEVRRANDLEKHWEVQVPYYEPQVSTILVSPNGEFLIHLRGNASIHKMDAVCVEVYSKAGGKHSYRVEELMEQPVETGSKSQLEPGTKWLEESGIVGPAQFVLRLADGNSAVFRFDERKVQIRKRQNKTR